MPTRKRQSTPETPEPRWLTTAQIEAWKAISLLVNCLPTALDAQLRRDSRLSYVEYYVLAGLSDQPGYTMRMSKLAMLANSELSRLSHLLGRLEKRGLVRREPDPADGRFTNAILTDAGHAHLVAAAPNHVALVRHLVIDALDDSELRAFHGSIDKIVARIDDTLTTGEC